MRPRPSALLPPRFLGPRGFFRSLGSPGSPGFLVSVFAPLVLAGCGMLGDGADEARSIDPADSVPTAVSDSAFADSVAAAAGADPGDAAAGAPEPAAIPDPVEGSGVGIGDAGAAALAPEQDTTLDARIDRVLAGQVALERRLDSLARTIQADAAEPGGVIPDSAIAPEQVLGQAGQKVRNFGVAIAWSILVLVIFNLSIRGTVWLLDTLAERNPSRRLLFKRLVPIVRIVLWAFAAYLIVDVIFRIDAQGLLAAAAAIGVAVGFAAQELLKNLFGGLILVFDQPFQVGDKIEVGGTYGEVISIGLRSTRIQTADDNLVSVPNAQVVDQQVKNSNAGQLNCQVVTDLFLPGWVDEAEARRIAFDAAASSKYVYLNKPIVTLVSDVFKETFLTRVRVKAYVLDPRLEFLFQSDVTERARAGFREAGLLRPEHARPGLVKRSAVGTPPPRARASGTGTEERRVPGNPEDDVGRD